jgi:L-threonylcarbamoyladenylate synthase
MLLEGGLVVYPTDTVYGLGASMDSEDAVARVFEVKQRERSMPFPILVGTLDQIRRFSESISQRAIALMESFFPGQMTLVFRASDRVPSYLLGPERTVALRIPDHPVPLALIHGIGTGMVGTSANLSGRPSAVTAEDARSQLAGKVGMILDGGRCPGTESTIVDVSKGTPTIVRAGAISREMIENVCGRVIADKET